MSLRDALVELLKVKTLVTLIVVGIFSYLTVAREVFTTEYAMLASSVITYYFAKKSGKEEEKDER